MTDQQTPASERPDPLSPAALGAVPEVRKAREALIASGGYDSIAGESRYAERADALLLAVRDATLSALARQTEEAVVEAAAMAMLTLSLRDAKEVDFAWGAMPQREREKYLALVRAALPLLVAPERARNELLQNALISANEDRDAAVARREQAEKERDFALDTPRLDFERVLCFLKPSGTPQDEEAAIAALKEGWDDLNAQLAEIVLAERAKAEALRALHREWVAARLSRARNDFCSQQRLDIAEAALAAWSDK